MPYFVLFKANLFCLTTAKMYSTKRRAGNFLTHKYELIKAVNLEKSWDEPLQSYWRDVCLGKNTDCLFCGGITWTNSRRWDPTRANSEHCAVRVEELIALYIAHVLKCLREKFLLLPLTKTTVFLTGPQTYIWAHMTKMYILKGKVISKFCENYSEATKSVTMEIVSLNNKAVILIFGCPSIIAWSTNYSNLRINQYFYLP